MLTIIVDLLALVAIIVGASMMFAQGKVRAWWAALTGKAADVDQRRLPAEQDPAHYALMIFGMMLFAFGIIILGFVTAFAWFSSDG